MKLLMPLTPLLCIACILCACGSPLAPAQSAKPDSGAVFVSVIENFAEKEELWKDPALPVCVTDIRWHAKQASGTVLVYAATLCLNAVDNGGRLVSTSGFGAVPKFYILRQTGAQWMVTNYDTRQLLGMPETAWIHEAKKSVPSSVEPFSDTLLQVRWAEKAAQKLGLSMPLYRFDTCQADSNCAVGYVCENDGLTGRCLKLCNAEVVCAKGEECADRCLRCGESACNCEAQGVCTPFIEPAYTPAED